MAVLHSPHTRPAAIKAVVGSQQVLGKRQRLALAQAELIGGMKLCG